MSATTIKDRLVAALRAHDEARPRSQQTAIGPSALGGCRRQVWHQMRGDEPCNPNTLRLAAVMGTAIHDRIEQAWLAAYPGAETEVEVTAEVDGVPLTGHIDLAEPGLAVDWKTITKKKTAYFPSEQQRWQVQVYGWMLEQNGRPVETVALVGICRDGNEDDIVVHAEPYDPAVAGEALDWLRALRSTGEAPEPERLADVFCADYCPFYGASCPGKGLSSGTDDTLDELWAVLVRDYLAAKDDADMAAARVEAIRDELTGISGRTADGITVKWSSRTSSTVDRDAIKAALGEVPMKAGRASEVLTVRRPR
jgi:hypothetical protein